MLLQNTNAILQVNNVAIPVQISEAVNTPDHFNFYNYNVFEKLSGLFAEYGEYDINIPAKLLINNTEHKVFFKFLKNMHSFTYQLGNNRGIGKRARGLGLYGQIDKSILGM